MYPFKVNINSLQGLEHVINLLLLLTGIDAPVIDKSPETSKAACETGQTASLVCRAEGAPNITFAWFKVRFLQALVTEICNCFVCMSVCVCVCVCECLCVWFLIHVSIIWIYVMSLPGV